MPLVVPHWDMLKVNGLFRQDPGDGREVRFAVLMSLVGRASTHFRCWPSVKTLMVSTGVTHKHAVSGALGWLIDHGAICNVLPSKRIGKEQRLLPQKYVFQLTGVILLSGQVMEYLYLLPEQRISLIAELRNLEAEYPLRLHEAFNPPLEADSEEADEEVGADTDTEGDPESDTNFSADTDTGISALSNSDKEAVGSRATRSSQLQKRALKSTNPTSPEASKSTGSNKKAKTKNPQSWKLAEYIEATLGIQLNAYQRTQLAKPVELSAGTMKIEYSSPDYMYINQRGFSNFVMSRVESYKAREKFDDIDMVVGDIRNYLRSGDKGNPGWLAWRDKHPEFTEPLPENAAVPWHQQNRVISTPEDEIPTVDLSSIELPPLNKPKTPYIPMTNEEYRKRMKLPAESAANAPESGSEPHSGLDE